MFCPVCHQPIPPDTSDCISCRLKREHNLYQDPPIDAYLNQELPIDVYLPVFETVITALKVLWQRRMTIIWALLPTFSLLLLADYFSAFRAKAMLAERNLLSLPLVSLILIGTSGILTLFTVTAHRLILSGESGVPKYGLFRWTNRETHFWLVTACLSAYLILITFPLLFVFRQVPKNALFWFFIFLPGQYVFVRLSLLLPGVAMGQYRPHKWAWQLTKGNTLALMILLYLIPFPLLRLTIPILDSDSHLTYLIGAALRHMIILFEIAILCLSYNYLTTRIYQPEHSMRPLQHST